MNCVTMTAGEIIALLSTYPSETPVAAVWEGQVKPFVATNFTLEEFENEQVLFIDVERC